MSSPETDFLEWKRRAEQDYLTIQALNGQQDLLLETIAFHAQQLAEKYLKAFLISKGWKLKKTHNLLELLFDAAQYEPVLTELQQDCRFLMPLAMSGRYPAILIAKEECVSAVASAERIRCEILKRLPDANA